MQSDRDAAVLSIGKNSTGASNSVSSATGWWNQLQQRFQSLSINQKIGVGAGVLGVVLALALAWSTVQRGNEYKVLFSNLNDGDGASIIAALEQMNVPYEFTPGGAAIKVPESAVYETRLKLAGQGLPKSGTVGFEILENQKFGTSQFVERVNYLRGLEGEISKSIMSLGQVKAARVHLAVPKPSAFVREQEKPTASVMLTLHPGRTLDPAQIAAINRLVSSAVPGMQANDVSVMDSEAGLLSPNPMRQAGLDATQLQYTAELEHALTRRLEALLEPLAGKEGYRASVTVDMSFDEVERTSETYGRNSPPNAQSIRSQQSIDVRGNPNQAGGVPGALTNQPPEPPEAPIVNNVQTREPNGVNRNLRAPGNVDTGTTVVDGTAGFRSERTTNYEVDRAIERLKATKGQVRRISAAVVLDNKAQTIGNGGVSKVAYSIDDLAQVDRLVKDAIGYVQTRGDTVSVVNMPFSQEPVVEAPFVTPSLIEQLVRYGAIALAILFAYFAVIRPLMNPKKAEGEPASDSALKVEPAVPEPTEAERKRTEHAQQQAAWEAEQEGMKLREAQLAQEAQRKAELAREQEAAKRQRYEELVNYTTQFARTRPETAALLLKAWVAGSDNGKSPKSA